MVSWGNKCKLPRFETNNEPGKRLGSDAWKIENELPGRERGDLLRSRTPDAHDISRRLPGTTMTCQSGSGCCKGMSAPLGSAEHAVPPIIYLPSTDSEGQEVRAVAQH